MRKHNNVSGLGEIIASSQSSTAGTDRAIISLIFAKGARPDADAIAGLAGMPGPGGLRFGITHRPEGQGNWLELLAQGLAFDCRGLVPGAATTRPGRGALFGLVDLPLDGEAVELSPGPHLAGAAAMLPVVRTLMGVAGTLAELPGVLAVNWHPARSWIEPGYFRRIVDEWLRGGAFPVLGLTSLERAADGSFGTSGLAFFTGRELQLDLGSAVETSVAARTALRLIHEFVTNGVPDLPADLAGPDGEPLRAESAGITTGSPVIRVTGSR